MPVLMGLLFIFLAAALAVYYVNREADGGVLREAHEELRREQELLAASEIRKKAREIRNKHGV